MYFLRHLTFLTLDMLAKLHGDLCSCNCLHRNYADIGCLTTIPSTRVFRLFTIFFLLCLENKYVCFCFCTQWKVSNSRFRIKSNNGAWTLSEYFNCHIRKAIMWMTCLVTVSLLSGFFRLRLVKTNGIYVNVVVECVILSNCNCGAYNMNASMVFHPLRK